MRLIVLFLACPFLMAVHASTGSSPDSTATDSIHFDAQAFIDSLTLQYTDSIEGTMNYRTGAIVLADSVALLNIPEDFKYLDAEQSRHVIVNMWGNPPEVAEDVLGMIMPADASVLDNSAFSFVLQYERIGYVKDDDADKIDYDELLEQMKSDNEEQNRDRREAGYEGLNTVGWAAPPFYDKERKVLHWALELRGDSADASTLNYNVRVLGRKGVLIMNAVAGMDQLALVQENIPAVLGMATFNDGFKYEQFDSNVDEVAAWTIGGLVAGKVLVKAGLFAGLLKFLGPLLLKFKVLWVALIAGIAGLWKWISGRRNRDTMPPALPPQA